MLDAHGDAEAVLAASGPPVEMLCRLFCNTFTLCDEELRATGVGA